VKQAIFHVNQAQNNSWN